MSHPKKKGGGGKRGDNLLTISQTIPQAAEYSDRKVKLITEQITKLQGALNVKRNNLEAVVQVMQQKISQLQM